MWVASGSGTAALRIDPAIERGHVDAFACRGAGNDQREPAVALADGDLWLPLFETGKVVRIAVPA